jgi:hypothetical protein
MDVGMGIEKAANTEKNYNVLNGGFKGLYNAVDSHLIPDGYLAAMENLEVDEYGCIHAVQTADPTAASAERSIMYCGCPVYQDYDIANDISGTIVTGSTSLGSIGDFDVGDSNWYTAYAGYDWTVYLNRFYATLGNVLRYSGVSKLWLATTWNGRNIYNFVVMPYGITHLQPMQSGLYIMGEGVISRLTEPNVGSLSEVYFGPRTPVSDGVQSYVLNNGSSLVYCAANGIYHFGGQGDPQRIDNQILNTLPITQFYVAEYNNRVWVLETISGTTPKLYAMNKTTGYWEYYNTQNMIVGDTVVKLGWPRTQNVNTLDLKGATWHMLSKLGANTNYRMPWTFTTKDYTPSYDAYTRVVHVKFFYLGQTGASTVATIRVYGDGVLIDTVTQEMLGTGLYHKDFDCAANLANSFHLVVTGTGRADIIDAGIEFTVRRKGDPNA